MNLCNCGCGKNASVGKLFLRGHHWRWRKKRKRKPLVTLCNCGCGENASVGKFFLPGHGQRAPEVRKRISERVRKGDVDDHFFKVWTPAMAWVLGMLVSDGSLRKDSVNFSSNDLEALLKIGKHMSSNYKTVQNKEGCNILGFGRKEMSEDLQRLGIPLAPKARRIIFPPSMPEEYMRHFIRGCWDGDGCVKFKKHNDYRYLFAGYYSRSKIFVETLACILYKEGISKVKVGTQQEISEKLSVLLGNMNTYKIQFVGRNCERLFHYLYDGVSSDLYMERKYREFCKSGLISNCQYVPENNAYIHDPDGENGYYDTDWGCFIDCDESWRIKSLKKPKKKLII